MITWFVVVELMEWQHAGLLLSKLFYSWMSKTSVYFSLNIWIEMLTIPWFLKMFIYEIHLFIKYMYVCSTFLF